MKMKLIKNILIYSFCSMLFSCASVLNPEAKVLKTESEWLNPSPNIRPVSDKDKKVYISVRNTSGSDLDIRAEVRTNLQGLGYQLTGDLEEANYVLLADLRYFGVKSERGYGATVGGAVLGGVAGAVVGNSASKRNKSRNTVIGGAAGAALGGLVGNMLDNTEKVKTLDIVVDLRIGEKIKGGVKTKVAGKNDRSLAQASKRGSGKSGYSSGKSSSSSNESASFTREENFYYHEARLVCSATKINLTEDEARDPLQKRLSNTISQILP